MPAGLAVSTLSIAFCSESPASSYSGPLTLLKLSSLML